MSLNFDIVSDINSYGLDLKDREIYLHSYVSSNEEDSGIDFRMASTFYKNIRILDKISKDPITIHMHSIGGNWNDGMVIYDAISMASSYVTILAYGQVESMSSVILQAADARVLMPNSYFMCHYGSSFACGNYLDVQAAVKFERKCAELMFDNYADCIVNSEYFKKTNANPDREKARNFIKRKLKDGDWYLTAEEAVYYGFADGVMGKKPYPSMKSLR